MLTSIVSLLFFPLPPVCIYLLIVFPFFFVSGTFCYGLIQYLTEDDHVPQLGEKYALELPVDFGFKVIQDLCYACCAKALHKLAHLVLTLMNLPSKFL